MIAIVGGQARLPTMIARSKGADLSASANLDLVTVMLDARMALAGPPSPPGGRPEIVISLRGPLSNPKRNIDVSALTGWLALRAVDQQSKKLEAMEQGRALRETPPIPDSDVIPDASSPDRQIVLPRPRVKLPDPPPAQKPAAAAERAAPLPPPLDIAPAPGLRRPLPSPSRPQAISPPAERNTF